MQAIKCFTDYVLCEGPLYLEELNSVLWVDIMGCSVHLFNLETKEKKEYLLPDWVGAIVPYSLTTVVCCVGEDLCYLNLESGEIEKQVKIFHNSLLRFNDAKCDRYGNLWAGTMCRDFNGASSKGKGSLFCIKDDVVVKEYKNFTIPNGMDWDDNYFYHVDTFDSTIYRYSVVNEFELINKKSFIKMDASFDGMCLDEDNNIWVALWGESKIICLSSNTKKIIDEIRIEEANASCISFGGVDYKTIFISSGSDKDLHNGSFYKVDNTTYKGKRAFRYKGK